MKTTLFSALSILILVSAGLAQTAPSATKDPVASSLRMLVGRSQGNIIGAISAMPADKFSYKPTPDQITFGHLVVHITESNNGLCSKVADVPAPKAEEVKDTDSKDKLLAAAKASFDFCNTALAKMDDSKLRRRSRVVRRTQISLLLMGALGLGKRMGRPLCGSGL